MLLFRSEGFWLSLSSLLQQCLKMCCLSKNIMYYEVQFLLSWLYIYIYTSGDSSLFLLLVPPPVNFSSQPVVRGPKVSHHSCY